MADTEYVSATKVDHMDFAPCLHRITDDAHILTSTRTPKRPPRSRREEPSRSSHTEESILSSMSLMSLSRRARLTHLRLLDIPSNELLTILHARARRRFNRGLKRRPMGLIKKLRKAKQEAKPNEKPDLVKTHLRDMIIVPEMIGSVVGVYSGKEFNQVEIKPEMVGFYLGEFSISYKPVKHGRPGIGATHSSRFIPLK